MKSYKFGEDDEMLLVLFSHLFVNNNDDNINNFDMDFLYERSCDKSYMKSSLRSGDHILQSEKLIEFNNDDGFVDHDSYRMSWIAKQTLFPELNLTSMHLDNDRRNVIKHEDIVAKQLFYDIEVVAQVDNLGQLLEEKHDKKVCERLKEQGYRSGFTCLFYGAPGTGKTETVFNDYTEECSLLKVRRNIINHYMLQRQEELLPDIIAFNDALREALHKMFEKAHAVYEANKDFGEDIRVEACCFLGNDCPSLHPLQGENRQELWNALQDSGWNVIYDSGVTFPLELKRDAYQTFDDFIGMNCPPPNWNEGLDQELTKDLHLIEAFHYLFDHTEFAITDFIYCRDFYYEIKVEIDDQCLPKQ